MPTHWESSERPLFVKTVIVNGSRHAILSEVDPLCQVRKPDSCNGYATVTHCLDLARDDLPLRRARSCYPAKRDISSDLQNCLVKLRVALSTQENKKNAKRELVYLNEDEKLKNGKQNENWKNLKKNLKRIKKSSKYSTFSDTSSNAKDDIPGLKKEAGNKAGREKDHEDYREIITNMSGRSEIISESGIKEPTDVIMKKQEHTDSMQNILTLTDSAEELFRNYSNYFFPIMYIKANVIPWDDEQSKNLLSERVLQWMHLAGKRKMNVEKATSEIKEDKELIMKTNLECTTKLIDKIQERKEKEGSCNNLAPKVKDSSFENQFIIRKPDEDVVEEVKQESDIETVLSSSTTQEYPKFSRELNKQHIMKFSQELFEQKEEDPTATECYWEGSMLSIPERESSEFSITEQLQQSILNSFEAIVSLERTTEPAKTYNLLRRKSISTPSKVVRRKGLHMKQASIRMSSDEDDTELKEARETRRKSRKSYREPKKLWEHKRRYKCLGQRLTKDSNDENEEPTEESIHILYNERPLNKGGKSWASELAVSRPQLHIFMPGIDSKFLESQEESASDTESYSK